MSETSAQDDVEIKTHEQEGSLLDGWPAMLLSLVIIGAAVYSFSPRPKPAFPESRIYADQVLVTDVAQRDGRIVGVGEQGTILYADDANGPWSIANLAVNQGSTFTQVVFVDDKTLIAVGHDSWIMRSEDAGKSWTEVLFDPEKAEPILGVAGPFDGKFFAYGAFGQMQVSEDDGKTWNRIELVKEKSAEPAAEADSDPFSDPFADPFGGGGDEYDPFAAFGSGGGFDDFSTRHINCVTQARDGSLWLAGERGLIARSTNGGETWTQMDVDYDGSFYGIFQTQGGRMMAHGMRGNIYSTRDNGESFQRSQNDSTESMYGGTVLSNGDILLVGSSNQVLRSTDNGRSFTPVSEKSGKTLTDVIPISDGVWLTAGEGGIRLQGPNVEGEQS